MTVDLDAIEARAAAASPGPWTIHESGLDLTSPGGWIGEARFRDGDVTFIGHARTDVPELVAEVRRLRGLVRRLVVTPTGWKDETDTSPVIDFYVMEDGSFGCFFCSAEADERTNGVHHDGCSWVEAMGLLGLPVEDAS